MDFIDMLWIPYNYVDEMNFYKYQVVCLDEMQDNNLIQRELMKNISNQEEGL